MKIKSAVFHTSAPTLAQCPDTGLHEFALIGRSNVGKSSLLNLLAERRDLARVSATPGKTQLINFFTMNDEWTLVDLPGYGYAKVSQVQRSDFSAAVAEFIQERSALACTFVLIDSRLPPQQIDLEFIEWLIGSHVPFAIVFTKTDKQSASRTREGIAAFKRALPILPGDTAFFATSAETKSGRSEMLAFIAKKLGRS